MVGQGKLNGQVEPDKALEEEPGGGVPDRRVLLRPDGGVSEGVLKEGHHHLQVRELPIKKMQLNYGILPKGV